MGAAQTAAPVLVLLALLPAWLAQPLRARHCCPCAPAVFGMVAIGLLHSCPATVAELLRFSAFPQLEHLDGHKVQVGAAGVTRPGETRWFQGEGMPRFEKVSCCVGEQESRANRAGLHAARVEER